MNEDLKREIKREVQKAVREEVPKMIEQLFGRSKEQLRKFFINNIE